jgi:FdhD protein
VSDVVEAGKRLADGGQARTRRVRAWKPDHGACDALVALEEPLEIRVDASPVAVTLRTPGHDDELAAGFVLTEGIIISAEELVGVAAVDHVPPTARGNVVDAQLRPLGERGSSTRARLGRVPSFITSACGVCGRGTIDAIQRRAAPLSTGQTVSLDCLRSLPEKLRATQSVFAETGGVHGAALFDLEGDLLVAREDIGRHNAVDKIVGFGVLRRQLPFSHAVLMVSGRAGFEIVLKAWIAGIPIVASVSAPSQLAVELADEAGMTLVGFLRGRDFTVYQGPERLGIA